MNNTSKYIQIIKKKFVLFLLCFSIYIFSLIYKNFVCCGFLVKMSLKSSDHDVLNTQSWINKHLHELKHITLDSNDIIIEISLIIVGLVSILLFILVSYNIAHCIHSYRISQTNNNKNTKNVHYKLVSIDPPSSNLSSLSDNNA